jgi:hypothetical protein
VADLFMAWSTPITGDLEQALHEASACLDKLRGQDEPFFTSVAEFTASTIETALGRYDQALRHLSQSRALADESGIRWLVAGTRVQLGILHVLQGKPDEARPVLAEALNLSLAARSTPWTALSLAGHARLALATGDARRAARLAGAAQGLRWRFGLQAWPMLRRSEAELVAQVRRALGGEQFDQAFADGSATQPAGEAVGPPPGCEVAKSSPRMCPRRTVKQTSNRQQLHRSRTAPGPARPAMRLVASETRGMRRGLAPGGVGRWALLVTWTGGLAGGFGRRADAAAARPLSGEGHRPMTRAPAEPAAALCPPYTRSGSGPIHSMTGETYRSVGRARDRRARRLSAEADGAGCPGRPGDGGGGSVCF